MVSWERFRPFMFAFIAAGFNAFVQTFFKALAESKLTHDFKCTLTRPSDTSRYI